jgi:hypothetical protein
MKYDISVFFENLSRRFKFYYNLRRVMGNLHDEKYINDNIPLSSSSPSGITIHGGN